MCLYVTLCVVSCAGGGREPGVCVGGTGVPAASEPGQRAVDHRRGPRRWHPHHHHHRHPRHLQAQEHIRRATVQEDADSTGHA